jgi:hypothetical protein
MHRVLITNPVRRALVATIGALIVALMLTTAPLGQAQASRTEITTVQCPDYCILVYEPVTCTMSDHSVHTFTNRCFAEVFACKHQLTIISCRPVLS